MQSRWKFKEYDETAAENLARELSIPLLLARLLVLRGISDVKQASEFLYLQDFEAVTSPELLSGMSLLVQRIHNAVHHQEKILIYGDYDVDGICSVVILMECMKFLGADADYRVPNRFAEGYGLNCRAVEEAALQGCQLIITVDCGITSIEEADLCKKLGIDLIITDHHNPGQELPDAYTIVNPKLDNYKSNKNLAGAGVAFKAALALTDGKIPENLFGEWVILAALATIADVVPLLDENRILVKNGLQIMKQTQRPGLRKLLQAEGLLGQQITSEKLAFQIIPKLNSAGRLETADISIQALLTQNLEEAGQLAQHLLDLNTRRKQLEDEMLQQVIQRVEEEPGLLEKSFLIVQGEGWNHGIIGILASRLVSRYHKPVLVLGWNEDKIGRGSGRSIEGVSLYDILAAGRKELMRFGGHKMAAGLTIQRDKFPAYYDLVMKKAEEIMKDVPEEQVYDIDMEVTPAQIVSELPACLEYLEPAGEGNPAPVFLIRGMNTDFYRRIGKNQEHVLCRAGTLEGVAFQQSDLVRWEQSFLCQDILCSLSNHEYMGVKSLQMMIQEFYPTIHYAEKTKLSSSPFISKIQQITQKISDNHAVMLLYDDIRCLKKHYTFLNYYFKSNCFIILHGEMMKQEKKMAESALKRGENKIFMVTHAALKLWMKKNNHAWPQNIVKIYQCWNRPRISNDFDDFIPACAAEPWETVYTFGRENKKFSLERERIKKIPGVIYINRPSTMKKIVEEFPQGQNELQQTIEERMLIRKEWQQQSGILLTDGVPFGNEIETAFMPGWIQFSDVPYSWGEIQSWMEINPDILPLCTFSEKDIQKSHELLEKIYPEEETLLDEMKKMIFQILEFKRNCVLNIDELIHLYQKKYAKVISRVETEGIFRIFCDLGLCEYRKKGSIMTIKLLSNSCSHSKEDSLYFWEGRESKASLNYCLGQINRKIDEEKE